MSHPFKWEFPGGKVEPGESHANALMREIYEELNLQISIGKSLNSVVYKYPDKEVCLLPFLCAISGGILQLKEHEAYRWLGINELYKLDLLDADKPILPLLEF